MVRSHRRLTLSLVSLLLAACGVSGPGGSTTIPTATGGRSETTPPLATAPQTAAATVPPSSPPMPLLPALPINELDAPTTGRLQAALVAMLARGRPDAIAALITADGVWSGAAGVDGPDGRIAATGDLFNGASISKPILAALVLQLDQDQIMDLDAPLATYLGDLSVDANGATVRNALAMRSGIGETPAAALEEARADCGKAWTRAETIPSIPAPHAEAGAAFEYSNPTYKLLGLAAEHATGSSLGDALDKRMFEPVGLDRILLQGPDRPAPKPWALPIAGHGGAIPLEHFGVGETLPCLGVTTFSFISAIAGDAPSLAAWVWALFGGRLIDRDHLAAMTTVTSGSWGLGIERLQGLELAFGMKGHQEGYASFIVVLPERQVVAVLFINDGDADIESEIHELVNALDG